MKKQACGITCVVGICMILVAIIWNNSMSYTQYTTPETCEAYVKNGNCGVWENGSCIAGVCTHDDEGNCKCDKKCRVAPFIIGVAGLTVLFCSFGYLGALCCKKKKSVPRSKFGFREY